VAVSGPSLVSSNKLNPTNEAGLFARKLPGFSTLLLGLTLSSVFPSLFFAPPWLSFFFFFPALSYPKN
jgi:hypothetical protein